MMKSKLHRAGRLRQAPPAGWSFGPCAIPAGQDIVCAGLRTPDDPAPCWRARKVTRSGGTSRTARVWP